MKQVILVVCSIILIAIAICINFASALMGSPATLLNRFTSICFAVFWFVFIYLLRNSRKSMFYSLALSIGLMITACMLLVYNLVEVPAMSGVISLIPYILVTIFFMPFYGFQFTNSYIPLILLMLILGNAGLWLSVVFIRRRNKMDGIK